MQLEHRLSALLQLHLHSRLKIWLQWIEQRQLQEETRNILALGLGALYIRSFAVYTPCIIPQTVAGWNFAQHYCLRCDPWTSVSYTGQSWWRHQMETFSALLALCVGNSPVSGDFPTQRPVTRINVFFDLRPKKRLSKQWRGWWFETLLSPLWRHCNDAITKVHP